MSIGEYIVAGIVTCVVGTLLIVFAVVGYNEIKDYDQEKVDKKEYQSFKKDTEVIKGTVKKAEKESHVIFPDSYNIIVKTGDNSKLISVDENEYRNYQAGSKAHFRIDTTKDNEIIRDLKKESDISTFKEYKKYKNQPRGLFESLTEKR